MIKNIIFDLGNVLISFKPAEFFKERNYSEDLRKIILSDIFNSEEWLLLDKGIITTHGAIVSIALKSSLKMEEIASVFDLRIELMFPLRRNSILLPGLKKRGFNLYYLSNFPLDIFKDVKNAYYFFKYFDGGLISAEVKISKPDIRIFKLFLGKYFLNPQECLFINDIETNVKAAEYCDMTGFCTFESQDISVDIEKLLKFSGANNKKHNIL